GNRRQCRDHGREDSGSAVGRSAARGVVALQGADPERSELILRIDAHHHLWKLDRGDYGWLTAEAFPAIHNDFLPRDIEPHLKACKIDRTILVQAAPTV